MLQSIRRCLGQGTKQLLAQPRSPTAPRAAVRSFTPAQLARPLGVFGHSPVLTRCLHSQVQRFGQEAVQRSPPGAEQAVRSAVEAAQPTAATGEASSAALRSEGLVFEIGITFLFTHYVTIFISLMRCAFQSFRPLLILFVFGQILKAVFFIAGAPIWFSFYSIWLFEVGYGLAQCVISFMFISFFYNNLSFGGFRQSLSYIIRSQRDKLRQAAAHLGLA